MAKKTKQSDIDNSTPQTSDVAVSDKYKYIYTRKSVERKVHRRRLATALLVFVLIAILVVGAIYAILSFIDFQSFRISVDSSSRKVLSLSKDYDFTDPTSTLSTSGPETVMDTTLSRIPLKAIMQTDGTYGQDDDNYIANSFYLINWTEEEQHYREKITITNSYKGLEDCIRVLVVKQESVLDEATGEWVLPNDEEHTKYIVYAAAKKSENAIGGFDEQVAYLNDEEGNPTLPLYVIHSSADDSYNSYEELTLQKEKDRFSPEDYWYCQSFFAANSGIVVDTEYFPIRPKQKIRYSIVVWIEGTDEDTTNIKLGGKVSMEVKFTTKQA